MGTLTTQYFLVIFIGLGLYILFQKPPESEKQWYREIPNHELPFPSWKGRRPDALPWGGWDQLVLPNPLSPLTFPPANGGEPWHEPVQLAYGGAPTPYCGNHNRRNTC